MTRNPILDELHAARAELLAEYNGDSAAYLRDAQARLVASGRPIWQGRQRTVHANRAVKPIVSAVEPHLAGTPETNSNPK